MTTNMNNRFAELTIERDLYLGRDAMLHMSRGMTVPTGQTTTQITARAYAGKNIIMTGAGVARTHILPRATGSGRKYKFYVGAVNTSGYVIRAAVGADVMKGSIISAGATVSAFTAAATSDTFTLNGTTTGGASVGDWVEFTDLQANVWAVTGTVTYTGTAATQFSDTVA